MKSVEKDTQMKHDKYSDQLLAQQDTLSTNTIFEILLGYSWHELSKAEDLEKELIRLEELGFKHTEEKVHAFKKEWITKTTEKTARAKQAAGTNLGRMKYTHAIPTKRKGNKILDNRISEIRASTLELRAASKAYTVLKKWMGIMFHNDPSGLSLDQSYMTVRFFAWIIVDNILEKLKEDANDFEAPARANEFIGYLTPSKDVEMKQVAELQESEQKPIQSEPSDYSILCDGDFWKITFNRERLPAIKNMDGMKYIHDLINGPQEGISCFDLYGHKISGDNNPFVREPNFNYDTRRPEQDLKMDQKGINDILKRKKENEKDLDDLHLSGGPNSEEDQERERELEAEIEKIEQFLTSVTDQHGKPKAIPKNDQKKVQNNVCNAITRAIAKIESCSPETAAHLNGSIDKGAVCRYMNPSNITWHT
jgi:hypothetical protein